MSQQAPAEQQGVLRVGDIVNYRLPTSFPRQSGSIRAGMVTGIRTDGYPNLFVLLDAAESNGFNPFWNVTEVPFARAAAGRPGTWHFRDGDDRSLPPALAGATDDAIAREAAAFGEPEDLTHLPRDNSRQL